METFLAREMLSPLTLPLMVAGLSTGISKPLINFGPGLALVATTSPVTLEPLLMWMLLLATIAAAATLGSAETGARVKISPLVTTPKAEPATTAAKTKDPRNPRVAKSIDVPPREKTQVERLRYLERQRS